VVGASDGRCARPLNQVLCAYGNAMTLSHDERRLMGALLGGEDPTLRVLRQQCESARVALRELSGSGFFAHFEVAGDVAPVRPERFYMGDVWFEIRGNASGGEAILVVTDGVIDELEAFAHDGVWLPSTSIGAIHYFGGSRDLGSLRLAWRA
jgi:hypothetical protein